MSIDERAETAEVAESLAMISGLLISEEKLDAILELVATLTARTLDAADGVSVTLRRDGYYTSPVYTNELTRRVDAWQYEEGEGPCISAMEDGSIYQSDDLTAEDRWPSFSRMAVEEGIHSILAVPFRPMGTPIGTLNIYSCRTDGFDESQLEVATVVADQAAIVVANAMAYSAEQTANGHLRDALESREVIGMAKGIVMAREHCSPDEAFDILRAVSQRTNRKLRDVAHEVVCSVERPA